MTTCPSRCHAKANPTAALYDTFLARPAAPPSAKWRSAASVATHPQGHWAHVTKAVGRANKLHKLKIVPSGVRIVAAARRALRQRRWRALVGTVVLNDRLASRLTWLERRRMHSRPGEVACPSQDSPSLDVAYTVALAKTAAVDARDVAREACIPLDPWRKWFSWKVVDSIVSQRNIAADNFMDTPLILAMAEAAVEEDGDVAAASATELLELDQFSAALEV